MNDDDLLRALVREHGTPLYLLDLDMALERAARLGAFDTVRYAQKAHPGLALLRALAGAGHSVDATSGFEILRARAAGFPAERIELATDVLDRATLEVAVREGVRANLGSADLIEPYAESGAHPECTLRINPGFGSGHSRRVTTGGPHSKHGIWYERLPAVLRRAECAGLRVTGLHVHIGSGVELEGLSQTIAAMEQALRDAPDTVVRLSAGGGLAVPYDGGPEFPVERYAAAWLEARARWQEELGRALHLEVEPGRYLVAPAGRMVTEVRACKQTPEWSWVLVDAGFHTLARPLLYGSYHRMSLIGAESRPLRPTVVAGPLCESGDLLTQSPTGEPRPVELPEARPGDLLVVHDAGAYGISMASNYNGFPLPAEVVLEGGEPRLARRRQSFDDLLALEQDL